MEVVAEGSPDDDGFVELFFDDSAVCRCDLDILGLLKEILMFFG
jgi:hypothetical protein